MLFQGGRCCSLVKALVLLLCLQVVRADDEKPNFIFIFADDLGYGDLKSYGHPYAKSDNLDRLAEQGTSFNYFHVTGNICPTSRAGFMTSRYPGWFPNYTPDFGFMGAMTVMKLLQSAGYVTGHIGKWNIGQPTPSVERSYDPYGISYLRITGDGRSDPRGKEGERYDLAIDFVEQHKDVPFYLNIWMYAVHGPVEPPPYLVEKFDGLVVDRDLFGEHMQANFDKIERFGGNINAAMKEYLGEVYGMDMQIGRLLTRLDELGLSNNTVVMFTSDNGPATIERDYDDWTISQAAGWAGGLRGGKHNFYEGGIRVPFIIRWPGHIPAGKVNNASFTSALDWLPTVATLAGAEVPWELVEGEDVSDIWFGGNHSRKNPTFYETPGVGKVAVHYNGWKMYDYKDPPQLFNLKEDRDEFANLYNERPEIVEAMKYLKRQYKSMTPTETQTGEGKRPLPFDPMEPVLTWDIPEILQEPTESPTTFPTMAPTASPSSMPTAEPTSTMTVEPTVQPTPETTETNGEVSSTTPPVGTSGGSNNRYGWCIALLALFLTLLM